MNEKVKQAFKLLCEQYVKDLNRYENKEIAKDYFYNPKYECGFKIDGKNVYFADILKAFDNMEELIKGKDEYIAKLCCDRAELKEHEKELIAEQHRLFDLAKEQENELKDLREFSKIVVKKRVDVYSILMTVSCIEYNERISYYYPSLADKKYLKKLLLTEEEWQFLKKLMRKEEYGKKED